MNVENNHTAETDGEQTTDGGETISIHTTLGDEDEDVHKCGRCQTQFSTLDAFIQHKLQHNCRRVEALEAIGQDASQKGTSTRESPLEDVKITEGVPSDETVKTSNVKSSGLLGRGHRKKITSLKVTEHTDASESSIPDSALSNSHAYKVNQDGRYVCQLCEKTFKTINILRTHLKTHNEQKNFSCHICGTSFHTKGSLVRHNRRHTDERPYRCTLCGQSFRESGALTRHLKAITPCTEKIRFAQYKEILVSKDGVPEGVEDASASDDQQEVVVVEDDPEEQMVETQTAVVSVVEAGSQEVLHQVHFTVEVDGTTQEQQLVVEQSQAEALAAAAAAGDSLICQAIINSGIVLGTEEAVVEEISQTTEEMNQADSDCLQTNNDEIQVKEEFMELEIAKEEAVEGDDHTSSKLHTCPHCNRTFKGLNYFRFHVKGHLGYKPFKCTMCYKEFLTGYLLKKHMEVHVSERRYKCGQCGKLYKSIGHVREHMRAHSDERPYQCNRCNKGYKTKNALQVHQRTHGNEKPYICQYCMKGFREKGSLVRHVRHHTGEKPYKCPKCSRGFAEHGTLNRHMRAKGGCHKDDSSQEHEAVTEEQASVDGLATAIISDDPHTVLVEFSSVVADTQEYIIKTQAEDDVQEQEVTLIQDSQNEMGNHIMKVVQRLVSQSQGSNAIGSRQIIVRNTTMDEEGTSISDCGDTITIATPESLTEQVAMTLASAINDGTLLATTGTVETADGTVTMVTTEEVAVPEEIQMVEQQEEYVITSPEEMNVQTVIV